MRKFIIYGAGKEGRQIYKFLKYKGLNGCVDFFIDQNAGNIKNVMGKAVKKPNVLRDIDLPIVIAARTDAVKHEIRENIAELKGEGAEVYSTMEEWICENGLDVVEWNRENVAYNHEINMDAYYDAAESEQRMVIFWGVNTEFYRMFQSLDLDNVIELACGKGRHVRKYQENTGHIVLVDILQKNIDACKERFKENPKISYYCNNGYNLEELEDKQYSALFCYDAMVHFEMMDIYRYLKDIYRVLRHGGMALLHHSNNTYDYRISFETEAAERHGRNYMSKDLFAYMAYRAGFEIVEQKLITVGNVKDLDCLSLIRKL